MDGTEILRNQVHALEWAHTIDLGDGVVTPGKWPPSPLILKALQSIDFQDKKVLDIGCWDGLWSFEAERRGAREVYATDFVAHRPLREYETFALARKALQSSVRYYPDLSVYDIGTLGVNDFDIVLFFGVYYHLKDPLLALARLRQVMKPGAMLLIEGETIHDQRSSYARFFYSNSHSEDRSNWWVPTIACLREWVSCSFFEVLSEHNVADDALSNGVMEQAKKVLKSLIGWRPEYSRCVMKARAVCRPDQRYVFVDEELGRFAVESNIYRENKAHCRAESDGNQLRT